MSSKYSWEIFHNLNSLTVWIGDVDGLAPLLHLAPYLNRLEVSFAITVKHNATCLFMIHGDEKNNVYKRKNRYALKACMSSHIAYFFFF